MGGSSQRARTNATLDTLAAPAGTPPLIVGALMDVVVWLRSLGLGKYEAAFCEDTNDDRTPSSP